MIIIDGQQIAAPSGIELGKFRLTKGGRTASGLMVMDIIAIKRKIDITWDKIAEPDLQRIHDLLDAATFHQVEYPDPQGAGGRSTITVYVGDISQRTWQRINGVRYWDAVKLSLIER